MSPNNDTNNVTIVTCFVDIYANNLVESNNGYSTEFKDYKWYIDKFRYIASSGIKICLYGCDKTKDILLEIAEQYKDNIKIMDLQSFFKKSHIYKSCYAQNYKLPCNRGVKKDTQEYMAVMNSKIVLIKDTIIRNPWNSKIFAWVDFGITYIFTDKEKIVAQMSDLFTKRTFVEKFLAIPGISNNKLTKNELNYILDNVHWRFCGGFFIGDKETLIRFYNLYQKYFLLFMRENDRLVWEVNFWAWLEANTEFNPTWYICNFSDSIIQNIPDSIFV